ncbi:hypothetical protein [Paenibacillus medicaginis]|uniref:Uncharacterized protein n=1 Tax=Paenibacillus medicaginis TaxID=1470560 RepID=A0ABV5C7W9_9BACL
MSKNHEIEDLLQSLSQEELIHIIAQVAEQDKVFRNGLLVKYTKGNHSKQLKSCQKLIDSIVKKYTGREGLIPYRETHNFTTELLAVLQDADKTADALLELEIALLVLEEGIEAFQYADDSNGNIGMLVGVTLEQIGVIANNMDEQDASVHEHIFNRLLHMSENRVFDGWDDFRIELLSICAGIADTKQLRETLRVTIEKQIASNANQDFGQSTMEALLKILFQLIQEYGSIEEAESFVQKHLHFTFFRAWAIEENIEHGNYQRALELAEEGERQDHKLPGRVTKWKGAKYAAYKKLSSRNEQEKLAKELLLDGDYAYYHELESLFEGDKEDLYRSILPELKETDKWRTRDVYLRLISEKNDLAEMLAYVKANPYVIEEYASRLSAEYCEEVEQIYSNQIYKDAAAAANRKQYRSTCSMLKRYKKIFGQENQAAIIAQLKTQYNRRPAFLDELEML